MAGRKKTTSETPVKTKKLTEGQEMLLKAYDEHYKRLDIILQKLPEGLQRALANADFPRPHYNTVVCLPHFGNDFTKSHIDKKKTFKALIDKYIKRYDKRGFSLEIDESELADIDNENDIATINLEIWFKIRP